MESLRLSESCPPLLFEFCEERLMISQECKIIDFWMPSFMLASSGPVHPYHVQQNMTVTSFPNPLDGVRNGNIF